MRLFQVSGVPARLLAPLLSLALVLPAVMVMGVVVAPPAAADAALSITKEAPREALVGEDVTYTLTVSNPGDQPLYNLSFRDVLPEAMTYVASSTPSSLGEPQLIPVTPAPGQRQTLIWSNLADLQPTSSFTLTFAARPDAVLLPVGSAVTNAAQAFGSTEPRILPRFDSCRGADREPRCRHPGGQRRSADDVHGDRGAQVRAQPGGRAPAGGARPEHDLHPGDREQRGLPHHGRHGRGLPPGVPGVPALRRGGQLAGRHRGVHRSARP